MVARLPIAVLPTLLEARTHDFNAGNRDFMTAGSLGVCVNAAVETIAIISRTTQRQYVLPIWWYTIYFAFSSTLVIYGTILAMHKCDIRPHRYSSQDLVQSLQTASDVLGKLGGDTRQVVRCQKIVRHLLKAAWALCPKPVMSQKEIDCSIHEGVTQERGDVRPLTTELASDLRSGDLMSGIDSNFPLEPYSFTDDMSSLFSSGFLV
ncbi:hypothetical protein K469DRAFT_231504 [Zopfia rhizophila CBS 207.26]|uniref:Uncharacterized protein n=1 Tax=Zopfia rhizophila CBS 207.26 TaxID=1314779 RepID=A0A6A6D4V6_9PEZI|nr:hypothetical protein K469DRAFT_231504 [Zopfia rhizophila CBS 207.26]